MRLLLKTIVPFAVSLAGLPAAAAAQDAASDSAMFAVNNTWMMVATFLVFIMH